MKESNHQLSKSTFLRGSQCHKSLFLNKHHKELRDEISDAQERIFSQGTSVGELARQLFPGGEDASPEDYFDFGPALVKTKQWISTETEVIYEAAFLFEGALAALDILVLQDGKYYAYEVKSSTEVKDYHLRDAGLQYWVMKGCGIDVEDFFIVHVNNKYIRNGELDIQQLFSRASVLPEVLDSQENIASEVQAMKDTLNNGIVPEIEIGPHCFEPFTCDFHGHCWKTLPQDSVFDISYIGAKAWEMYNQGIIRIKDIPDDYPLQERQKPQVEAEKTGTETFNAEAIKTFFSEWEFPLYFFDFETIGPAVPIYDGTSPYQQYPFQYSLHIMQENGTIEHLEYLGNAKDDPRLELTERMLNDLGKKGSIVTYNMGFEKGKIAQLAVDFPEREEELLKLNERVVDLIIPFKNHWCYKVEMKGSASIKSVLPSLIPELSYKDLNIQEGGSASAIYAAMCDGSFTADEAQTRKDLIEYCKLDTLAMVEIYLYLRERIMG